MKYLELVGVYENLESTTKRLQKTKHLSEFLKKANDEDLGHIVLLVQGRVFPPWDERKIGVAAKLLVKTLNIATGLDQAEIESEWKKTGDIGEAAANTIARKKQATLFQQELTTNKVFDNLRMLAGIEGQGSVDKKIKIIAELLTSAKPEEAKYIIRTIIEDLRVGLGEGTMRDAITWSCFEKDMGFTYDKEKNTTTVPDREQYNKYTGAVQNAFDIVNDFAEVTKLARKGLSALQNVELKAGMPIKVMLFQKVKNIAEAFEKLGKPMALEYKYDGFRIQIHKQGNDIKLFTRRLEEVTKQFPEVVEAVKENVKGDSFILDSEAVGYDPKTKKYLPFQNISQRIKRKYNIPELAKKFPVELNIFDIIFYNGDYLAKTSFGDRRKLIEKTVTPVADKIKIAEQIITDDEKQAEEFYKKSLEAGNEGVMAKNLQGIYKPGSRVGYGVKIKPVMETLDVVIVGGEWGEGKRSDWISSLVIAVRNPDTDELVEIGKVGTGLKEKPEEGTSFGEVTELLKPLIIEEKGKEVRVSPKIVIEVNYEEIQASPTYKSGFALRFPRFVKLREDRSPEDVSSLEEVKALYGHQRGRN